MYLKYFALVNSYSQLKQSAILRHRFARQQGLKHQALALFSGHSHQILSLYSKLSYLFQILLYQTTEIENDQFHVYIIPNITVALENIQGTSNHLPSSSH